MDDNNGNSGTISIVRADQMMLIGELIMGNTLKNPRMMVIHPARVTISEIIGKPKSMFVEPDFHYPCEDTDIINAYRQNVSGIQIARSMPENVLQISGRGAT